HFVLQSLRLCSHFSLHYSALTAISILSLHDALPISTVMSRCLHSAKFQEIFPAWERHGFHVTPVHFYQPIPDTQSLPETLWDRPDRKSTRLNCSHQIISYAVFCLKKKKKSYHRCKLV